MCAACETCTWTDHSAARWKKKLRTTVLEYSVKLRMCVIDIPYVTLSMHDKHIRDATTLQSAARSTWPLLNTKYAKFRLASTVVRTLQV